MRFTHL